MLPNTWFRCGMLACPYTNKVTFRHEFSVHPVCGPAVHTVATIASKCRFTRIDHCAIEGTPRGHSDAISTIAHLRTAPARSSSAVSTTHGAPDLSKDERHNQFLPVFSPKWLACRLSNASCSQLPQPLKEMAGAPPDWARRAEHPSSIVHTCQADGGSERALSPLTHSGLADNDP